MATDDTITKCILEIMMENEQEEDINIRKVRLGVALIYLFSVSNEFIFIPARFGFWLVNGWASTSLHGRIGCVISSTV
jgi:hypothetical protein